MIIFNSIAPTLQLGRRLLTTSNRYNVTQNAHGTVQPVPAISARYLKALYCNGFDKWELLMIILSLIIPTY